MHFPLAFKRWVLPRIQTWTRPWAAFPCAYHTTCRAGTRPLAAACALQIIAAALASSAWLQIQDAAAAAAAGGVAVAAGVDDAAAETDAGPCLPSRWAGEPSHSAGRSAGDYIRPN